MFVNHRYQSRSRMTERLGLCDRFLIKRKLRTRREKENIDARGGKRRDDCVADVALGNLRPIVGEPSSSLQKENLRLHASSGAELSITSWNYFGAALPLLD